MIHHKNVKSPSSNDNSTDSTNKDLLQSPEVPIEELMDNLADRVEQAEKKAKSSYDHSPAHMEDITPKEATPEATEQATKEAAENRFYGKKTLEYLKKLPNWKKLSKKKKRFLDMVYPQRWCNKSYTALAKRWGCSRKQAIKVVAEFEAQNLIIKEHRMMYKAKTGEPLKKHRKNYYCIERITGEAYLKAILDELFEGYEPPNKKLKKMTKTIKKISARVPTKCYHYVKEVKPRPELQLAGQISLERGKILGLRVYLKQSRSKKRWKRRTFVACVGKNSEKSRSITTIFEAFGFKDRLDELNETNFMKLLSYSIGAIRKVLQLIHHKLAHNWKLKNFWAFFFHEMKKVFKQDRFAKKWFPFLAREYRDELDGKETKLRDGIDSSISIEQMKKMEEETGKKITEKSLDRALRYGTEMLKSALNAVGYRMSLGRGSLPDDKKPEDPEKGRPIYEMVKVNITTKKPYTEEDRLAGVPFTMMRKIVGYEPVKKPQEPKEKTKPKQSYKTIKCWISLTFFALKKGSLEAIKKAFFEKKEKFKQRQTESFEEGWAQFDGA